MAPLIKRLTDATKKYWRTIDNENRAPSGTPDELPITVHYLQHVLPLETEYLRSHRERSHWPPSRAANASRRVVVVLAGHSFEPLALSLCAWQPDEILFILSREYGEDSGNEYFRNQLQPQLALLYGSATWHALSPPTREPITHSISATKHDGQGPGLVFDLISRGLREKVKDSTGDTEVMVDITGGKKSMVAGAYLYAAVADLPITYVDFEKYDAWRRRPFSHTCSFGRIANAYQQFAIPQWHRAREGYETHLFGAAGEIVCDIRTALREIAASSRQRRGLNALEQCLRVVDAWMAVDYRRARQQWNDLRAVCPAAATLLQRPAFELLADHWPDTVTDGESLSAQAEEFKKKAKKEFLPYRDRVLCHAQEECTRIRGIIERIGDGRGGLLRSIALIESVLKTIVLYTGMKLDAAEFAFDLQEPAPRKPEVHDLILAVENGINTERGRKFKLDASSPPRALLNEDPATLRDLKALKEVRNNVAHGAMPVPLEVAKRALTLAELCIEALALCPPSREHDGETPSAVPAPEYPPPWEQLLEACGVDLPVLRSSSQGGVA